MIPITLLPNVPDQSALPAAERLRQETAATRISFTWLGVRKTLTNEQTAKAADGFDAEARYLSATKKLLDTQHPRFKTVTALRGRILAYWKGLTLPYPEPGLRLIRQHSIPVFDRQLQAFQAELADVVAALNAHYAELRFAAQLRLGQLFSAADYPASLKGEFAISWEFPSLEPPDYLRQLSPQLYAQECQRARARFDEAIDLAEQMFLDELSRLVSHLAERLSGADDGKPKVFRDSAVENLTDFFERFQTLNIRSNADLEALVARAQAVISGVAPQALRDNATQRRNVAAQMTGVQAALEGLFVDRPRRSIVRPVTPREAGCSS